MAGAQPAAQAAVAVDAAVQQAAAAAELDATLVVCGLNTAAFRAGIRTREGVGSLEELCMSCRTSQEVADVVKSLARRRRTSPAHPRRRDIVL